VGRTVYTVKSDKHLAVRNDSILTFFVSLSASSSGTRPLAAYISGHLSVYLSRSAIEMAGSPLQTRSPSRGNHAPGSPSTPGSPARSASAGQLLAIRILESDIHDWSDRVRERIERAQRGVLEGEEAGVQILGEAARRGREVVPLQRFLLYPVERPSTGLGRVSGEGREHAGRSEEEPRQKAMADTHMAVTLLTCLANKIDLKALERIAMRDMGRTLRTLILEDCSISDDDIPFLAAGLVRVAGNETVCKVRTLALTNNYITAKGAAALAQALNVSSSLQELYLDWNKCGAEGCRHLAEALAHNTSLSLLHLEVRGRTRARALNRPFSRALAHAPAYGRRHGPRV